MTLFLTIHIVYIDDEQLLDKGFHHGLLIIVTVQIAFSMLYSLFAVTLKRSDYFKDFWNWVDNVANILILVYLVSFFDSDRKNERSSLLAYGCLFVYLRLLSYYRIFKQTRYYIRMLVFIPGKIASFLIILATITLSISFSFKALRQNVEYEQVWMASFRLMQGDFEEEYPDSPERIIFTIACLLLPIIWLNLLIAIVSDAFDEIQEKADQAEVREKLNLIKEIGKFIFWDNKPKMCYIHWLSTTHLREVEEDTWLGKVKELKNFVTAALARIPTSVELMTENARLQEANSRLE